ncbi:MAG: esterase-like activity of phytase family protein, partial [Candidatus Promineifilaceae bacterium]
MARERRIVVLVFLLSLLLILTAVGTSANQSTGPQTVVDVEYLGQAVIPSGTMFAGTEIGGLSSITYDAGRGVYHTLSDDQGNRATGDPVRYYTVAIDLADGTLENGDVTFVDVTQLFESKKEPFAPGGLDPEGFTLGREGFLFMSSEGNILSDPILDPFIRRYNLNGRVTADLPIPGKYIPNGVDWGVRFNLSFESLNVTPDGRTLVTAGEGAIFQDGPASSFTNGSLARLLEYDLRQRVPVAEYVYEVGPWAEPSAIFGVNGIVEVLPIDDAGTMLVMERSFSVGGVLGGGTGNYVVIKEISTQGATDVLDIDALYEGGSPISFTPVTQRQIFAFDDLGVPIDNIEGMTFGPPLPDGR